MRPTFFTAVLCAAFATLVASSGAAAADASTPAAAPTPTASTPTTSTPQVQPGSGGAGTTVVVTPATPPANNDQLPNHSHHDHDHDHANDQPPASKSATPVGPTNDATHLWQNPESPTNPGTKQPWDQSPKQDGPKHLDGTPVNP